ncbi:DNA-deoxyinosine glycosylase [Bombiscardovia nodaiensis]|uniref:DNA-deoxyinosine glycosylase n=1 Tax=Bombiscardovia nodaiensis TaxID=2932181 RepID=A0ABN6SC20_9BIFI|nr:DNA-deoxyinosine glycosylase [Bombiscardovia nodaiensis]
MTHVEHGFGPVWNRESRVLVLGSMPSPKSRQAGFYFMNPHNRFWPVMEALFDRQIGPSIAERRSFLLETGLALWDVIASCDIQGAQDASIRNALANDLRPLLSASAIGHVFVSGATATRLYRQLIQPQLNEAGLAVPMTPLPSTSPANARMSLEALRQAYRPIMLALED